MSPNTVQWSSKFAFILASAGAAVGLGNIWRFPYVTGENGGGAFVLVYLFFVFALGLPIMMSEVLIGRRGRHNPAYSFRDIAIRANKSPMWKVAGLLPILCGFTILCYYLIITGWVIDYFVDSVGDTFNGISIDGANFLFNDLLASPMHLLFWSTISVLATVYVIARGVHRGLELTMYFVFPAFLILIIALIIYAVNTGSFMAGFEFIFKPDFSKLTREGVLVALGQAFFTLSISTGAMLAYGAYVSKETNIGQTVFIICIADTLVALIAGLTIFPIVFANGLEPDAGPSLIFKTLPLAFGHMPYGSLFAAIFFLMLFFAAFTSAVSLLEPSAMYLMDAMKWSRVKATSTAGFAIWIITFASVASLNVAKDYLIFGMSFFDFLDYTTANVMIPVGALLLCIFTGWRMSKSDTVDELQLPSDGLKYKSWRFVIRYMAPLMILIIFLSAIGVI